MAFRKNYRRNYRRRPGVANKALTQKPTAQNQKKQIYTLAKKVNYLQRQNRIKWNYSDWRYETSTSFNFGTNPINFKETPLIRPGNWFQFFQDSSATDTNPKQYLTSMKFKWSINHNSETEPANYWVFLVRPRFQTASHVTDQTTYLSNLTSNVDYYFRASPSSTAGYSDLLLNKSRYQVLYAKRMNLGKYIDQASTVISTNKKDYQRSGTVNLKFKKPIMITSGGDMTFTSMLYQDIEPWKQIYVLMATDDSNADTQYASYTWLASFRTKST